MNTQVIEASADTGLHAILAVRPRLDSIALAGSRVNFPKRTLLHAGPPFASPEDIALPVLNSAAAAAVFECWYTDLAAARAAILASEIHLQSAQDFDCVVPLASVLSPSQYVLVVDDAAGDGRTCFAPLNGGNQWALRLGLPDIEVVDNLRWLNEQVAPALVGAVAAGIDLIPLADHALAQGDDCHGRTLAGTAGFAERIAEALDESVKALVLNYLDASPGFFLNLWMAASKCILTAAEGKPDCQLVTSAGGNGRCFGLRVADRPERWVTAPALPPSGVLITGYTSEDALPAIGDSAIVEMLGFGAMAMWLSPDQQRNLGAFMPEPAETLSDALLAERHPGFVAVNVKTGLFAQTVVVQGKSPVVALGILHAEGVAGRIGGGVYKVPPELFENVVNESY
ncbi:hypothetical protein ADIMK_1354 [Marinobacterium lacunae]|uniref:DUF1116 domain-containing protein n=1 Tax=Marinobacterium lacunae TaxID=1232683 RepID=A0A081G0Z5_9GAMM|nr:DUF1116 domain-containing protein [Marinobacterium lacunae]KEA64450.1 hypothetical protein ADIMK_1354 [Marinobacterium lacunae]